jgi:hypothetical protein
MRKPQFVLVAILVWIALLALPGSAAAAGRTFTVGLTGGPTGDPDGTGTAILTINPGQATVCYEITVSGISQPQEPAPGLGSGHIHVAPSGAIAVDLETQFTASNGGFLASDCVSADRAVLVNIMRSPADYYVNIHTVEFPGGAVSGSLG